MAESAAGSTGRIFISYRRDETAYPAGWLYDRLTSQYGDGQIFKDVDSIELGDDFVQVITTAVSSCDVLLALIGERWLTLTDDSGARRVDDPEDFVRLEIEAALTRDVRVIPILVDGAKMPRAEELPDSLAPLRRRHALELSPSRFEYDTGRLLKALDSALAEARTGDQVVAAPTPPPPQPTRHIVDTAAATPAAPAPAAAAPAAAAPAGSPPREPSRAQPTVSGVEAPAGAHRERPSGDGADGIAARRRTPGPPDEQAAPVWLPTVCRIAGATLIAAVLVPLVITDTTTRFNTFAVFSPFEAVLSAVTLWVVAGALRGRRVGTQFAAGLLVSVGALMVVGALGMIGYAGEWVGAVAVLLSLIVLVGGCLALVAGVSCLRVPSTGADQQPGRAIVGLAALGTGLTVAALFLKYDGESSLWTEVEEGSSAAFAYLPITAVVLLATGIFLLLSRPRLAAGLLCATGALTAGHFLGVLLAATFAVGEVGEVRIAWVFGVAGGLLTAWAGWQSGGRTPTGVRP